MNALCMRHGKRFVVLTNFSDDSDPTHPHQEIVTFLKDHGIEFINVAENYGDYGQWGYVNYDGHTNFLTNYLAALTLYNSLEHRDTASDFHETFWYKKLSSTIDFEKLDFHNYVFGGNWDKYRGTYEGKTGRWLRASAKSILKSPVQHKASKILIEGISPTSNNAITVIGRQSDRPAKAEIANAGLFSIILELEQIEPTALLLFELEPVNPVFVTRIKALDL